MITAFLAQVAAAQLTLLSPAAATTANAPPAADQVPAEKSKANIAEGSAGTNTTPENTPPTTDSTTAKPAEKKPPSFSDTIKETVDGVTKAGSDAVKSVGKVASDVAKGDEPETAPKVGGVKAAKLVNDLQDIKFGQIIFIIMLTWLGIAAARIVLPFLAKRGPSQARLYLLGGVPIIRLFLLVTAILWIIPLVFNVTLQNFLVIAGAASVAIGFAFKDYASSLIAGIVAIFERPYRPGDWVKIDGDYGEVKSVGLRAISLVTAADDVVTVPHDRIWTNNILNSNDGARTLMCIADFYLAPGHDGARMRSVLWDVAISSAYLNYDKPVRVMLSETPWGTHYKLKAYPFDLRDQFSFISDMTVRGKLAIAEAGGVVVTAPAAVGGSDGKPLTA